MTKGSRLSPCPCLQPSSKNARDITLLTSLENLLIQEGEFNATLEDLLIPSHMSQMSNLTRIALYSTQTLGTISEDIGLMLLITSMSMFNNSLTATWPNTQLGRLSGLKTLESSKRTGHGKVGE
jgi:hypothetical protein